MRKVREVLRLRWVCGLSQRHVASSCGLGSSTVGEYLERAERAGVRDWAWVEALGDEALERRLFPPPVQVPAGERPEPESQAPQRAAQRSWEAGPGAGEIRHGQDFTPCAAGVTTAPGGGRPLVPSHRPQRRGSLAAHHPLRPRFTTAVTLVAPVARLSAARRRRTDSASYRLATRRSAGHRCVGALAAALVDPGRGAVLAAGSPSQERGLSWPQRSLSLRQWAEVQALLSRRRW